MNKLERTALSQSALLIINYRTVDTLNNCMALYATTHNAMDKENACFNQLAAAATARPLSTKQHHQQSKNHEKSSSFRKASASSSSSSRPDDEMAQRARQGKQWTLNDFEIGKPLEIGRAHV